MRHRRLRVGRGSRASESGFVLIQVLAFSLLLAMITFALVSLSMSEYSTVTAADKGMRAFFIADAAVERAIGVLRADGNWNDGVGADKNANNSSWQPLYDKFQSGGAGGNAVNLTYPSGGSGTYSIYVKRPIAGGGLNPADDIWIRAIGAAGTATRSIEVQLHRLTPLDFSVYSAQTYQVSTGGGNVTLHGSAYFFQDLGLKAVKTGIYNDRQIQSSDTAPYLNQLYVRGTLDMSTGNPTVGTLAQPMYGVHAGKLNLKGGTGNLYTLELDNVVPAIPYPNVAGFISSTLSGNTYANLLSVDKSQLMLCVNTGGTWSALATANLTFGSSEFTIPAKSYSGCGDGTQLTPANYVGHWTPSAPVPLALNSTYKSSPIFVPGYVSVGQKVTYSGIGTFVVKTTAGGTGLDLSGGQVLASTPASGATCSYATPSSMPSSDLLSFIVAGNVVMMGSGTTCAQENDVVVVAGAGGTSNFTSSFKVQVYGVVITEQLDTTQNPDFWQVPDILTSAPTPLVQMATNGVTMPVVVRQWRELSN